MQHAPASAPVLGVLVLLPLLALAPGETRPQQVSTSRIESELVGIRAALEQIASLMREQITATNRDTVLRRIEIKNARLVPVESALRGQREMIENLENEQRRFEERIQELGEIEFYSEDEDAKAHARAELAELSRHTEMMRQQLGSAQARELELEREVDVLQDEIDALESRLDER